MTADPGAGLPVVGMVGGGQLARMTHQAAIPLGLSLRVLAESATDSAAVVANDVVLGDHRDAAAVHAFAAGCDVVTFDHEHVPGPLVAALEAAGHTVLPGAAALAHAQDKVVMRRALAARGLPVPRWTEVPEGEGAAAAVLSFGAEVGWPVVVKAARGGYDGRGVWVVADDAHARDLLGRLGLAGSGPLLAEERVAIVREVAAVVARSPYGQVAAWPVVETVQRDGICVEVVAPAPGLDPDRAAAAQQLAIAVADGLGVVGVLAVELFETADGLVVNELAMRPHNSGHWTIEGSRTSQFEQHLRAVLDYPLGDTTATAPWTVMANVLGGADGGMPTDERLHHCYAADPGAKVHWYGKAPRPGRKLGHVTVQAAEPGDAALADARRRAARAAHWLRHGAWPEEDPA